MEPNKFEKHIKDTLEKRTIQPSKDAWNQLENKLNASTKQQKSNRQVTKQITTKRQQTIKR